MRVWHTSTVDPTTSRRSAIPIPLELPPEPQVEEPGTESVGEVFNAAVSATNVIPTRPKRKQGNNGVSRGSIILYRF